MIVEISQHILSHLAYQAPGKQPAGKLRGAGCIPYQIYCKLTFHSKNNITALIQS